MSDALLEKVWLNLQEQINALRGDISGLRSKLITYTFPTRWTGFHADSLVLIGGALATTIDTTQYLNSYASQATPAQGDSFTNGFMLKSGTYTMKVYGKTGTDAGIVAWYVDNTFVAYQDWYAGSAAFAEKTLSVPIVSDGMHVLRGVVYDKNSSSSGYALRLTAMSFTPGVD